MRTSAYWITSTVGMLITLVVMGSADGRAPGGLPPQDPPQSAELKVLGKFIGTWDTKVTLQSSGGGEQRSEASSVVGFEWVLRGRFLHASSRGFVNGEPLEVEALTTYDTEARVYRRWVFTSGGSTSKTTGTWNKETLEFMWTSELGEGITLKTKARFTDDNTVKWTATYTNKDGSVAGISKGTMKKRKP